MAVDVVFETHSTSEDNERGIASGWHDCPLSDIGRQQARELGERRGSDAIEVVFTSDLARATETARLAFGDTGTPILHDWRLRECDYGKRNGTPAEAVHRDRARFLDTPHPGGESWRQAVARVGGFLDDLPGRWDGTRVLVVGHVATHWGLEHFVGGVPLEDVVGSEFVWRPGWEYRLS